MTVRSLIALVILSSLGFGLGVWFYAPSSQSVAPGITSASLGALSALISTIAFSALRKLEEFYNAKIDPELLERSRPILRRRKRRLFVKLGLGYVASFASIWIGVLVAVLSKSGEPPSVHLVGAMYALLSCLLYLLSLLILEWYFLSKYSQELIEAWEREQRKQEFLKKTGVPGGTICHQG